MRKVVVSEFLTLDGVMEAPEQWQFPYFTPEIEQSLLDGLSAMGGLLLGRTTYEIFASSWPFATGPIADRMNGLPKYVVSTTLDKVAWQNSTLLKGDVAAAVAELKRQPGGDISVIGSNTLARTLRQHDLVDQYSLMIHPVVVGRGQRLFIDGIGANLRLIDSRTFSSGVVTLTYEPVAPVDASIGGH